MTGLGAELRVAVVGGCAAMLAACHGYELEDARNLDPAGSDFNTRLYAGYIDLSRAELGEYDYWDSDGFALKAAAAAGDAGVMPADLDEWRIPGEHLDELSKARARLVNMLDASGRTKTPETAAHAQIMFDCWVQEQEEGHQPDDIAACRNAFYGTVIAAEVALRPPAPAPAEPEPEPAPEPEPEPSLATYYVVFFDFDSADLSNAARQTLDEAAAAARELRPYKILIHGHADRAGPERYNMALSERRARSAATHMIERGAGRFVIDVESLGESKLAAKTSDDVRDGRNRRVEVTLDDGE